ncbi:ABC transporter permease [Poseidonocella sp. HB161398]|uniref:ABC transporter permease n=1 Tax=Poseidonocella sp. HB161398 TaxID=2320855 RepID=UPI00197FE4FE|nr:ABC transporter permease [Poseidonocella sp. HB161398]
MSLASDTAPPGSVRARLRPGPFPVLPVPALLLVGVGLILPLILIARYSLAEFDPADIALQGLTLENYAKFFGDPFYREVLGRTVAVAAVTTLCCLALGIPAAYAISRSPSAGRRSLLLLLAIVPLLMGNAVRVVGWMVLLSDGGVLNTLLMASGLREAPLRILYTSTAVIVSLVAVLLPFMVITLQSVFDRINPAFEEAAATLGAPPWTAFFRVFVPLAMPGIFSGGLLVFILGMNAYASPVLLGGPAFHMMAPMVYEQAIEAFNWPFASALAFILMAATLVLTLLSGRALEKRYGRL